MRVAFLAMGLAAVGWAAAAAQEFPAGMAAPIKKVFLEQYLPAHEHKAIAVTPDLQHFQWLTNLPTAGRAARTASLRCLAAQSEPCRVWMVDGQTLLPAYDAAARAS